MGELEAPQEGAQVTVYKTEVTPESQSSQTADGSSTRHPGSGSSQNLESNSRSNPEETRDPASRGDDSLSPELNTGPSKERRLSPESSPDQRADKDLEVVLTAEKKTKREEQTKSEEKKKEMKSRRAKKQSLR